MQKKEAILFQKMHPDNEIAYDSHAGTVTGELLVGRFGIVLLRLYELMVEVHVV